MQHVHEESPPPFALRPAALRRGYRAGVARYGRLALTFRSFAERVLPLATDPASPHLADLYLAVACESSDDRAAATLARAFVPRLARRLVRQGTHPVDAEAEVRDLLSELFARPRGSNDIRLARYAGRAPLGAWLAASLRRRRIDRVRRRLRGPRTGGDRAYFPPSDRDDPSVSVERREGVDRTARALRRGLDALSPRQRDVLFHCFVAGRTQREAARRLGIGEPRVSRLVEAAARKLRAAAPGPLDAELRDRLRDRVPAILSPLTSRPEATAFPAPPRAAAATIATGRGDERTT